jgi:hypothetical protein
MAPQPTLDRKAAAVLLSQADKHVAADDRHPPMREGATLARLRRGSTAR